MRRIRQRKREVEEVEIERREMGKLMEGDRNRRESLLEKERKKSGKKARIVKKCDVVDDMEKVGDVLGS